MKELSLQNCRLDGRYDIREMLGRGSYAEIYTAKDILASERSPHHTVVIKALNVFMQDDLDADLERTLVENFQNEAIALDRVRHPNIISRLGHGTARDLKNTVFHYMVLEYLPGGDLSKLCQRTGLPLEQALNYLEQVCAGLAHAHKANIIHRDIKPQNLLLTADRKTVKIADFGVARITQDNSPVTRVGTNMYAPPEHSPVFADSMNVITVTELTPAADIYSLAKSAYVLITGESPRRFTNMSIGELPFALSDKPWASEFLRVLRKATQNDPKMRHQSVTEFWQDLVQVKIAAESAEAETMTEVAARPHMVPQASISADFSPKAPVMPKFNTSRDLRLEPSVQAGETPQLVIKLNQAAQNQIPQQPVYKPAVNHPYQPGYRPPPQYTAKETQQVRKPKHPLLKRTAYIGVFLVVFASALYTTQNYVRNNRILPRFTNPFAKPTGIAKTDINLRSSADKDSDKIGLVPKGSRVRVLNTKDNWKEIDIIEYSGPKQNPGDSDHGWVNGQYIDLDE